MDAETDLASTDQALCDTADRPSSGTVRLSQSADTADETTVLASFTQVLANSVSCSTSQTIGRCSLELCTPTGVAVDIRSFSAGTLRVKAGAHRAELSPDASNVYPITTNAQAFWNATTGGEVTVSGDGADVHPFHMTVRAPKALTLVSPASPTDDVTPDANGDITLSWTGGTGTVNASVGGFATSGDGFAKVTCVTPSWSHRLVIPGELLDQVALWSADLFVTQTEKKVRYQQGFPLTVELQWVAVSAFIDAPFP